MIHAARAALPRPHQAQVLWLQVNFECTVIHGMGRKLSSSNRKVQKQALPQAVVQELEPQLQPLGALAAGATQRHMNTNRTSQHEAPCPSKHSPDAPSILAPFFRSLSPQGMAKPSTTLIAPSPQATPSPLAQEPAMVPASATGTSSLTDTGLGNTAQLTSSPAAQKRTKALRCRPVGPFQASASQFLARAGTRQANTHGSRKPAHKPPPNLPMRRQNTIAASVQPLARSSHSMHDPSLPLAGDVALANTAHRVAESRHAPGHVPSSRYIPATRPVLSVTTQPSSLLTAIAESQEFSKASFTGAADASIVAPVAIHSAPATSAAALRQPGGVSVLHQPAVVPVPPHLKARAHPSMSNRSSASASPAGSTLDPEQPAAAQQPFFKPAIDPDSHPEVSLRPAPVDPSSCVASTGVSRAASPSPAVSAAAKLPAQEPIHSAQSAVELLPPPGHLAGQQEWLQELSGRYRMPASLLHTHHGGMILPVRTERRVSGDGRRPPPALTALRVHSVTWNMGRTKPTHELAGSLRGKFLGVSGGMAAGVPHGCAPPAVPDVIVVGTQENAAPGPWLDLLQGVLRPEGYVLLRGAASMNSAPGGSFVMTIAVFVRRELEERFSDVRVGRVTCGLGNKVRHSFASPRLRLSHVEATPCSLRERTSPMQKHAASHPRLSFFAPFGHCHAAVVTWLPVIGGCDAVCCVQAGNKGACAVAFTVSGGASADVAAEPTRVLLLCCHLEAHSHRLQRRNANLRHILSTLHLKPPRSRRGLSQTLLTSFLPSHMSPLRGRSRTRASATDSQYLTSTSGHMRGHSLPANTPAFNPSAAWQPMRPSGGAPGAGLRGIAEGKAPGTRQHARTQSLQSLRTPRSARDASDPVMAPDEHSRRSASLPSGAMPHVASDAAHCEAGTAEGDAAIGAQSASDEDLRASHSAVVASLQHWDCSRVDVGSMEEDDSDISDSVTGGGCHSGAVLAEVPGRYTGSWCGSWSGSEDLGTAAAPGQRGRSNRHGASGARYQSSCGSSADRAGADGSVAGPRPGWAGQSPDIPMQETAAWGGARRGGRALMQQVSQSAEDMRRSMQGARTRMGGCTPEPPATVLPAATPRATTPPPGSLMRQVRGGDGSLMSTATPGSSGRSGPDFRSAVMRLGREISTPKLAAGFAGESSLTGAALAQGEREGPPLHPHRCAPTAHAARAARLRQDLRAAAADDSPLAAAVCEGIHGPDSESSSMHMSANIGVSDEDSLDEALSSPTDMQPHDLPPALAQRYCAPAVTRAWAPTADGMASAPHCSKAPPLGARRSAVTRAEDACLRCRVITDELPLTAGRVVDAGAAGQRSALTPLTATSPQRALGGDAVGAGAGGGGVQEAGPLVEAQWSRSASSGLSSDLRHAPASPGFVSREDLLSEAVAAAALPPPPASSGVVAVQHVDVPSPFAWRCNSTRQQVLSAPSRRPSPAAASNLCQRIRDPPVHCT